MGLRLVFLLSLLLASLCELTLAQQSCKGSATFRPRSYAEVGLVITQANEAKTTVKAIGGHYSNNDIACTTGFVVSMQHLNKLVKVDRSTLRATVQAGMTLEALLEELEMQGLTLAHFPDFGGLTIGGIIATGSFSSSLSEASSFHEQVISMVIANGAGQVVTVPGSDLDAFRTNLGLLGIVVEVTLQVTPIFKVSASVITFKEQELFSGYVVKTIQPFPRAELFWFPESNVTIARIIQRIPIKEEGRCHNIEWKTSPKIWKELADTYENLQKDGDAEGMCVDAKKSAHDMSFNLPYGDKSGACYFPVGFPQTMLLRNCVGSDCPWANGFQLMSFSCAIPMANFYQALDDIRDIFLKTGNCFPNGGINIRFLKKSNSYLSLSNGGDQVVFEISTNQRYDPLQPRLGLNTLQEIEQLLVDRYGGRGHWGRAGLSLLPTLETHFPDSKDLFLQVQTKYDPHGVFRNEFSSRVLGITSSEPYPFCALDDSCRCDRDTDCAEHQLCSAGVIYDHARVCVSPAA